MTKEEFDKFIQEKLEIHGSYDKLVKFLEHGEKAIKPSNDAEMEDLIYGQIYNRLTTDQLIVKDPISDLAQTKFFYGRDSQAAIINEIKPQIKQGNKAIEARNTARQNDPLGKNMKPEKKIPIPTQKKFYEWLERKGLPKPGTSPKPKKLDI